MATWSSTQYQEAAEHLIKLIERIKNDGTLPNMGEYNYYVVWGSGNEKMDRSPRPNLG